MTEENAKISNYLSPTPLNEIFSYKPIIRGMSIVMIQADDSIT